MTNREVDNIINRINKKLDRARTTLGENSLFYGHMVSTINIVAHLKLISREGRRYQIKRGNAVNNLSTKQRAALENHLKTIENQLSRMSLADEKKQLRAIVKEQRKSAGLSTKGRVSYAEYRAAESQLREAGNAYGAAIEYFYKHRDNSAEFNEAMTIAKISGRRKTYAEWRRVAELANIHAHKYAPHASREGFDDDLIKSLFFRN